MCLPKSHNLIPKFIITVSNKVQSPDRTSQYIKLDELYHNSCDNIINTLKDINKNCILIDEQFQNQSNTKLSIYEQKINNEIDPETCLKIEETENRIIELQKEAITLKYKIDQEKINQEKILKLRK